MTDVFTPEVLDELIAARAKRTQLDRFIIERFTLWKTIAGGKPILEEGAYIRNLRVEVDDETLYNPAESDVKVLYKYTDAYDGRRDTRTETVPKAFIFDADGTYEQKLRAYKALEADLNLTPTK